MYQNPVVVAALITLCGVLVSTIITLVFSILNFKQTKRALRAQETSAEAAKVEAENDSRRVASDAETRLAELISILEKAQSFRPSSDTLSALLTATFCGRNATDLDISASDTAALRAVWLPLNEWCNANSQLTCVPLPLRVPLQHLVSVVRGSIDWSGEVTWECLEKLLRQLRK